MYFQEKIKEYVSQKQICKQMKVLIEKYALYYNVTSISYNTRYMATFLL